MNRKTLISTIAFAFITLLSFNVNAQNFSGLDKSPLDISMTRDKSVKIVYSRPQLKGRDIAKLAPNGKMWRTGANEGTEITFYNNTTIGGKKVEAGTYTLTTIPGEKEWTIVLNSNLNVWGGNAGSRYNKDTEVARFTAKVSKGDESLEAFSIAFDKNNTMYLGWDTVRVAIPIN
ncbi:DUF2911 domain-containing protein [Pontimicrobium sp. IMCC45349]|uniref:DUF2911 domain-containing protein n=1 Tax=Pontimicrobium sp. IMCC45349 TaxID=3391574 RepID=UPI0039A340CA